MATLTYAGIGSRETLASALADTTVIAGWLARTGWHLASDDVTSALSRRTRDRFQCVACGHADHADLNAAANILASGTGASARGGCRVVGPVNREIDRRMAA